MKPLLILCFYKFQVDMYPHIIADDQAARFGHAMPAQTEVLAVDLAIDADPGTRVTPGVFYDTAEFCVELDILRHAADSQIAPYFIAAVIVHILIFGSCEF